MHSHVFINFLKFLQLFATPNDHPWHLTPINCVCKIFQSYLSFLCITFSLFVIFQKHKKLASVPEVQQEAQEMERGVTFRMGNKDLETMGI